MTPTRKFLASWLMTLLLLTSAAPAFGHSSQGPLTGDEEKAIEAALVELEGRRREVEALKVAVGARDERIRTLERIVADQEKLVALWKESALARKDTNTLDDEIKASYDRSVKAYETELGRVRGERDRAKRQRNVLGVVVVVLIVTGAVLAGRED